MDSQKKYVKVHLYTWGHVKPILIQAARQFRRLNNILVQILSVKKHRYFVSTIKYGKVQKSTMTLNCLLLGL